MYSKVKTQKGHYSLFVEIVRLKSGKDCLKCQNIQPQLRP